MCRRFAERSGSVHHRDEPRQRHQRQSRTSGRGDSEPEPHERRVRGQYVSEPTGSGKTWLACALAHQAARGGLSVLYVRAARLFDELQVAHGDGSFARRLAQMAKLDLLVIDDFAISPIGPAERCDLLELLDDRIGARSTLITSQLPVKAWHTYLGDPTLADAILDRVVHSSHKIELKGTRSMRDSDGAIEQ